VSRGARLHYLAHFRWRERRDTGRRHRDV